MMTNLKYSILFVFLSSYSFSQNYVDKANYGKANISENFCVTIDDSKELNKYYVIDIVPFNFVDAESARKKFGAISNNLLTYKVDYPNKLVYLEIHSTRTKNLQSSTWWKNYILSLCSSTKSN